MTIAELARRVGLSEKRLKAGFRAAFGKPVYRFLQEERLAEAGRMLAETQTSVTEASLAVGYTSISHFIKIFVREFGILPSAVKVMRPGDLFPSRWAAKPDLEIKPGRRHR